MQLHQVKPNIKRSVKKRVGRGGLRGKTSGRGHKGQKARAGGTPRPELRDIIKKIPKLRGHGKNRAKTVHSSRKATAHVSLDELSTAFTKGDTVNPSALLEKGLIEKSGNRVPHVKILATGELKKALTIEGCKVSGAAKEAIEKAGGTITYVISTKHEIRNKFETESGDI